MYGDRVRSRGVDGRRAPMATVTTRAISPHSFQLPQLGSSVLEPDSYRLLAHAGAVTYLLSLLRGWVVVVLEFLQEIVQHFSGSAGPLVRRVIIKRHLENWLIAKNDDWMNRKKKPLLENL